MTVILMTAILMIAIVIVLQQFSVASTILLGRGLAMPSPYKATHVTMAGIVAISEKNPSSFLLGKIQNDALILECPV